MLDLKRLAVLARSNVRLPDGPLAVDTIRHRVFVVGGCSAWVFDAVAVRAHRAAFPCAPGLAIDALSFDGPRAMLTVIGHTASATVVHDVSVDEDRFRVRWSVARSGSCDDPRVARMKHGVVAACTSGGDGNAIWIPTWHGTPIPDAIGDPVVRVTRARDARRVLALDAGSGRVVFEHTDGGATIVDAPDERLVATLEAAPPASAWDAKLGRAYAYERGALTASDLRYAPSRERVTLKLPRAPRGGIAGIDARLHRAFVPVTGGLVAIDDGRATLPLARDGVQRFGDPAAPGSRGKAVAIATPPRARAVPVERVALSDESGAARLDEIERAWIELVRAEPRRHPVQTPNREAAPISLRAPPLVVTASIRHD